MALTADHLRAITRYANRVRGRAPADRSHFVSQPQQLDEAELRTLLQDAESALVHHANLRGRDVSHLLDALARISRDPVTMLQDTLVGTTTRTERVEAILLRASELSGE